MHTSQPFETHYFPVNAIDRRVLLHTHYPAPYIPRPPVLLPGSLNFTIYSPESTDCKSDLHGFTIHIDWSATLGRLASRYPTTVVIWAVGVVALLVFGAWGASDKGLVPMPTVEESLSIYVRKTLGKLLLFFSLFSFLPLPEDYYLGNGGEILFSPVAPLLLLVSSGLVCLSWLALLALMWPLRKLGRLLPQRRRVENSVRTSTAVSMCFIFALIFLFVPWQVAYLGCWLIHLNTCASWAETQSHPAASPSVPVIPLIRVRDADGGRADEDRSPASQNHCPQQDYVRHQLRRVDNHNHSMHILLLMTWLLPLAGPVLVVWVRTLVTAGLTTPFDGDHDFLGIAPFLILVDFASWNTGALFERQRFENSISLRWSFAILSGAAFLIGSRRTYCVFDAAKIAIGFIVVARIGRRYWGGASWSRAVDH